MIGKVQHGADAPGLVRYLLGPGKANEHVDQRVVAGSWPDMTAVLGGADAIAGRSELTAWLTAWDRTAQAEFGRPPGTVWHLSLSIPAADGRLSDVQWAHACEEVMTRVGLHGPDAVGGGVRWVAIHHGPSTAGNDHVHIAAMLVDQLGTPRRPWQDYRAVRAACQDLEARWGLTATGDMGSGGPKRPTRAETERATRSHAAVPPRVRLEAQVRAAAALSGSFADFSARLTAAGVQVRPVHVGESGKAHGVVFGDPNYVTADGSVIEFSGKQLAPDLTLPKLEARWAAAAVEPVLRDAEQVLTQAAARIEAGDPAAVWSAVDHLSVTADLVETDPRGQLHAAALALTRATGRQTATAASSDVRAVGLVAATLRAKGRPAQLLLATQALMDTTARLHTARGVLTAARAAEAAATACRRSATDPVAVTPTTNSTTSSRGPNRFAGMDPVELLRRSQQKGRST